MDTNVLKGYLLSPKKASLPPLVFASGARRPRPGLDNLLYSQIPASYSRSYVCSSEASPKDI